jgi:DNA relaxase NicK
MAVITWTANIDYVTASYSADLGLATSIKITQAIRDELAYRGERVEAKRWGWCGYVGTSYNGIARGERHDGVIVRCSGERAHGVFKRLPQQSRYITRLDLAVTLWFTQDDTGRAKRAHIDSAVSRETIERGRPWKLRLVDGTGDGDTLYVGSRSSEQFGRLYDKGRESDEEEYTNAWRWEVEYKGEAAQVVAEALSKGSAKQGQIAATVQKWFARRGVSVPLDVGQGEPIDAPPVAHKTDDDKKLMWLNSHVKGTVRKLIDAGRRDEVLLALGLNEVS